MAELYEAAKQRNRQLCLDIVDKQGFDMSFRTSMNKMTLLHKFVLEGMVQVAIRLLQEDRLPEVNVQDSHKCTALHYAAWKGDNATCRAILHHPDFTAIAAKDSVGKTALHYAAEKGMEVTVEIAQKMDATALLFTERNQLTAAELASDKGHAEVARLINELVAKGTHPVRNFLSLPREITAPPPSPSSGALPRAPARAEATTGELSLSLSLPGEIRMIVDSSGGLLDFVNSPHVTPENANKVSKFLGKVLKEDEQSPEAQAVAASMLLCLMAKSKWTQINRMVLWDHMRRIFVERMPTKSAGKQNLCLTMCSFLSNDDDHGFLMRDMLEGLDWQERTELTVYIIPKVSTEMAAGILGFR